MSRVVIDIECIGVDFDSLDATSQESLLKNAATEEEREIEKGKLALWPVTGEVITIAMLNVDTGQGRVLYQNNGGERLLETEGEVEYSTCANEKELLEQFWDAIQHYRQVITFNGRGFDAPYLLVRSAANEVVPTKNLMPYRYDMKEHCDLADQLAFYGSTRRFSLHMYAQALGIDTPKEEGIDGSKVGATYKNKEYKKIAEYCMRDVIATKELYDKWEKYILGR